MPPHTKFRTPSEFQAKLGVVFEEIDECVDWLPIDLRDSGIAHDAPLLKEAEELARIFARAVATARKNTRRMRRHPNS